MKSGVIGLVLLAASSLALADSTPNKALVEQYLKESRAEQVVAAEVEGYVQQFGADATPEAKTEMERYIKSAIGWDAIKDQYASLVQKTYTTEELKAALTFLKTPAGSSITQKNGKFSQEMATLIAGNFRRVNEQAPSSASRSDDPAAPTGELIASDVEEHNVDGRVYFTGMVENRGKRPVRGVQVEVNLFFAGKFVDQYTTYVSGTVVPGVPRYFKVSCGCKDSPPAPHDSFKIHVIEGY